MRLYAAWIMRKKIPGAPGEGGHSEGRRCVRIGTLGMLALSSTSSHPRLGSCGLLHCLTCPSPVRHKATVGLAWF